jgi:hypothetical protein
MVGSFSAGLLFVPAITQDFLRYRPKVGTVIANLGTRQEKVSILRWRQWDTNRSCPGNPLYSTSRTEMKKNRAAKTSSSYFLVGLRKMRQHAKPFQPERGATLTDAKELDSNRENLVFFILQAFTSF